MEVPEMEFCDPTLACSLSHGPYVQCFFRGSRDTYGAATNPSGQNPLARGKDVDTSAIVGKRSPRISRRRGANSEHARLRSRRHIRSVLVLVASRHGEEDAVVDHGLGRGVERGREPAAEGHVGNRAARAAAGARVGDDVVQAGDDAGDGAAAGVVKDLDAEEGGRLGYAVCGGTDCAGDVGAVAVAVGVGAGVGDELLGAAAEVLELGCENWTRGGKWLRSDLRGGWPGCRCRRCRSKCPHHRRCRRCTQ